MAKKSLAESLASLPVNSRPKKAWYQKHGPEVETSFREIVEKYRKGEIPHDVRHIYCHWKEWWPKVKVSETAFRLGLRDWGT